MAGVRVNEIEAARREVQREHPHSGAKIRRPRRAAVYELTRHFHAELFHRTHLACDEYSEFGRLDARPHVREREHAKAIATKPRVGLDHRTRRKTN